MRLSSILPAHSQQQEAAMPALILDSPLLRHDDDEEEALKQLQEERSSSPSSILIVAKLALSFLCVYSAMDALSEYITSLLPNGLGDESLFLLQAALCVSTLVAPVIVSSIGELRSIMLGGAAHAAYMASLVAPTRWTVLATSVFCGFGASLTWVAQGTFLTKCTPPSKRGLYTGVFWGIYSLSAILGNLAAFVTFKFFSQDAMFGLGSLSALVGVLLMLLIDDTSTKLREVDDDASIKLEDDEEEEGYSWNAGAPCKRAVMHALLLLPITLYLGCQAAFWTGEFTKLLPAKTIGLVLLFTGIGQVFGSFVLSWLSDHIGCATPTFLIGAVSSGIGLSACFPLQSHISSSNYEITGLLGVSFFGAPVLAYVAGLLFGIADGVVTSHVFAITGRIFQGSKPEIWAVFNLLGTAGAAGTFWLGIVFPVQKSDGISCQVWVQMVILLVGTPLFVILDLWSAGSPAQSLDEPLILKSTLNEPVIIVPVVAA